MEEVDMFDDYEDYRMSRGSSGGSGGNSNDGCLKWILIAVGVVIFLELI